MSDWVHIGEPEPPLTPTQKRIKELLDQGKKVYEIVWAVHMGKDFVLEEIYQIRKWESIMGKKPKFNKSERAELLRLHNEERYSVGKLAAKYSCSQTAIKNALNAAKIEAEEEPMQHTGINEEFDAAVDEMIAESKAADAEKKSAIAEIGHSEADLPAEKDTLDTESDTSEPEQLEGVQDAAPDKLPPVVRRAVIGHLNDLEMAIEDREQRIDELQMEIEEFRKDIAALEAWKEAHHA